MTIPTPPTTRVFVAPAALLLASGLGWVIQLVFVESPWTARAGALAASGLLVVNATFAIAAVLAPSRWLAVAATVTLAAELALALTIEPGPAWWVAVLAGGTATALLWRRKSLAAMATGDRPDRVPVAATALALVLLATPAVVGLLSRDGVTTGGWVLALAAFMLTWAYVRAVMGALWLVRLVIPVAGVWALVGMPAAAAAALGVWVALVAVLGWLPPARVAVQRLTNEVTPVPILPEMVPADLLEQAGFDRRGRPKRRHDQ